MAGLERTVGVGADIVETKTRKYGGLWAMNTCFVANHHHLKSGGFWCDGLIVTHI